MIDWQLVDNRELHKLGDYVKAYPPYESPAIICKVIEIKEEKGWFHYKIVPLSFFEKLSLKWTHKEIKDAFPKEASN